MTRTIAATGALLAVLSLATAARAQECGCCNGGKLDLTPPPPDPELVSGPSTQEYQALLATGAAVAIASYIAGVFIARTEPNSILAIDAIPFAGPLAAATRNSDDHQNAPLLSFLASAQAMGLLMVAAAATEIAERRQRVLVGVSGGPNGCAATLTLRIP